MTRDGTAEPVRADQILKKSEQGQKNVHFSCSADHWQVWQPYTIDPYPAKCDNHTYIHIHTCNIDPVGMLFLELKSDCVTNEPKICQMN